jgi:hypothetical protein
MAEPGNGVRMLLLSASAIKELNTFHNYDEKHKRDRVALAKTTSMRNTSTQPAIDEDFGARRGQQHGNPVSPSEGKAYVSQHINEKRPGN